MGELHDLKVAEGDQELRRDRLQEREVERPETDVLHELLEARLQNELAESLDQIETPEQDEHRAEIPAVQHGRVAEQHEDRGHAR